MRLRSGRDQLLAEIESPRDAFSLMISNTDPFCGLRGYFSQDGDDLGMIELDVFDAESAGQVFGGLLEEVPEGRVLPDVEVNTRLRFHHSTGNRFDLSIGALVRELREFEIVVPLRDFRSLLIVPDEVLEGGQRTFRVEATSAIRYGVEENPSGLELADVRTDRSQRIFAVLEHVACDHEVL